MGTYSISEAAEMLGVGRATVRRRVELLGIAAGELTEHSLQLLVDELGVVPRVLGLTREAVKVLAALAGHPLGLRSVRAAARIAKVSQASAAQALGVLESRKLATRRTMTIPEGRAVTAEIWCAATTGAEWQLVAGYVRATVLPKTVRTATPSEVPPRLRHVFWNASGRVPVAGNADYIAGRVLVSGDLQALAWGSFLPGEAWRRVAAKRGLTAGQRALAMNLAGAGATS